MFALLAVIVALLVFEIVIWRYGTDSRDGDDWVFPKPTRRSPVG
jgi:hypothetical protein